MLGSNTISSAPAFAFASSTAWRNDPAPESAVVVTVNWLADAGCATATMHHSRDPRVRERATRAKPASTAVPNALHSLSEPRTKDRRQYDRGCTRSCFDSAVPGDTTQPRRVRGYSLRQVPFLLWNRASPRRRSLRAQTYGAGLADIQPLSRCWSRSQLRAAGAPATTRTRRHPRPAGTARPRRSALRTRPDGSSTGTTTASRSRHRRAGRSACPTAPQRSSPIRIITRWWWYGRSSPHHR